jgi:hypothetical protein
MQEILVEPCLHNMLIHILGRSILVTISVHVSALPYDAWSVALTYTKFTRNTKIPNVFTPCHPAMAWSETISRNPGGME